MRKRRSNLIGRLAVPLAGLLVTAHLLIPEERIEAKASRNDLIESIRLDVSDGVEIVSEGVYTKEQLFSNLSFQELFENRQVWGAFQTLRSGKYPVCLYFVDFRNDEDAAWAAQRLADRPCEWSIRMVRVFGTALAYTQAPFDTPKQIIESLLDAVSLKAGAVGAR